MAGSQTAARRRRRDESPVEPEPRDGAAVNTVDIEFDERTLGETETEAERAAAAIENQGAEVDIAIDVPDDPAVDPPVDAEVEEPWEDDLPEPVTTNVSLNLGRRFGVRKVKLVHLPGCPGRTSRVESDARRTPRGRRIVITRCCDCAQQTYTRLT